jgi:hypothetical protein
MELQILEHQILHLRDSMLLTVFEEGGVVFDVTTRRSHVVNRAGAGILELLNGKRSVREVVRAFAEICDEPEEAVSQDAAVFLKDLLERGWLHVT